MSKITYEGKEYNNYKSIIEDLGLSYNSILSYRAKNDVGFIEAIEHYKKQLVTYKGKQYRNLSQLCRELGLNGRTIKGYIKSLELNAEEAINLYLEGGPHIKYKNQKYSSWREVCKTLGLNYSSIFSIRRREGISWEEAIDIYKSRKIKDKEEKIILNGIEYESMLELCLDLGLKYDKVRYIKSYNKLSNIETLFYIENVALKEDKIGIFEIDSILNL